MKVKTAFFSIAIIFLVIGIMMMAVAEHADGIFFSGVLLFTISIVIFIMSAFWKVASTADSFFTDH